jgi:hypothetical protein
MSNSEHSGHSGLVPLDVNTSDAATEIFVIDGLFRPVEKGLGSLTTQLKPGIYKLRIRAGYAEQEDIVVLRDEPVHRFYSIRFSSPAPLRDTAEEDPRHVEAAERESQAIHVAHGTGSCIFIFARRWGSAADNQEIPRGTHPARGLGLNDSNGIEVANLETTCVVDMTGNPWAACTVRVDPGLYRLGQRTLQGDRLEQTIVAAPTMQTQVFLLQRTRGEGVEAQSEPLDVAIIYSSRWRFDATSPYLRLSELARLGLRNDRQVLSDAILDDLLHGKFQDPMLGLFGAHLLLRQKRPELANLGEIVTNLRGLLGPSHPDVEALALLPGAGPTSYVFSTPPMLRKSWALVLEATVQNPALVPYGSLASRVANHLSSEAPWILWSEPSEQAKEDLILPALTKTMDMLVQRMRAKLAGVIPPPPPPPPPFAEVANRVLTTVQDYVYRLIRKEGPRIQEHIPDGAAAAEGAARIPQPLLNEEMMKTLVDTLRIPRANVEALLEKKKGGSQ